MYPGSFKPEDHDFHGRTPDDRSKIYLTAEVDDFPTKHGRQAVTEKLVASAGRTDFTIETSGTHDKVYATNEDRASLRAITINADRRLSYQLSYSSKYTWLSKLMRRFHSALKNDPVRVELLRDHFESLQTIFEGVPEFTAFRTQLRAESSNLALALEYGLEVDLSAYDASNYFRSLRMQASQEGIQRSFEEMGTGQEQLLAIAFGYAYAKAFSGTTDQLLLVIEEPEAHLHPVAQEWLASQVLRFATDGIQVLITTHSPYFVSLERLGGAVRINRESGTGPTTAVQNTASAFGAFCAALGAPVVPNDALLQFYDANATTEVRSGLLSSGVVLVEGETEELSIPNLILHADAEVYRRGWKVVRAGSKSAIAKWIRLFRAYEIPCYVIFDSDEDPLDCAAHVDIVNALGINLTDLEPHLREPGIACGDRLTVMCRDYETAMRHEFPLYADLEREAREAVGLRSKPSIGRYVAARLPIHAESGIHKIVDKLRVLSPVQETNSASTTASAEAAPHLFEDPPF